MTTQALAREPGPTASYPWKFILGQTVYAQKNSRVGSDSLVITGGELFHGCPYLQVMDIHGQEWILPQLHCSSKPSAT
jgi:hypothetical protein